MDFAASPAPTHSPWGVPDRPPRELAPGIWSVTTSSHGGLRLSDERNALVPPPVRATPAWYEEDCCWALVALVHPDAFSEAELASARETVLQWQPEAFTLLTGVTVRPGQSRAYDQAAFYRDNPDAWVVTSASGDWAAWVELGMVGVCARQGEPGSRVYGSQERYFLVPEATYAGRRGPVGYVIDLARDREIPTPSNTGARRERTLAA